MMQKTFFLLLLSFALFPSFTFAEFSDIEGHWGEEIIKEASEKGIINGYSDGSFKPDNNVTLGEGLKIALYTMQGNDENSPWHKDEYQEEGAWYNNLKNYWNNGDNHRNELLYILHNGDDHMERGEAIYMLMKAAGIDYEEIDGEVPSGYEKLISSNRDSKHFLMYDDIKYFLPVFSDLPRYHKYFPYVQLAYDLGVIDGYSGQDFYGFKVFGLENPVSRAELTKIALNIKNLKDSGTLIKTTKFTKGFEGETVDYKNDEILSMYAEELTKIKNDIKSGLVHYGSPPYPLTYAGVIYGTTKPSVIENDALKNLDSVIYLAKNMPKDLWENEILNQGQSKYLRSALLLNNLSQLTDSSLVNGAGFTNDSIDDLLGNGTKSGNLNVDSLDVLKNELVNGTNNAMFY